MYIFNQLMENHENFKFILTFKAGKALKDEVNQ